MNTDLINNLLGRQEAIAERQVVITDIMSALDPTDEKMEYVIRDYTKDFHHLAGQFAAYCEVIKKLRCE